MLKIRLQKTGKKNAPSYRIVLCEHTSPPQGKFIEILGHYNPRLKQKGFKKERIEYWLTKGAQASPTVHNLLVDEGIVKGKKVKAWRAKKKEPVASQPVADKQAGPPKSESFGGEIKEEVPKEEAKPEKPKAEVPKEEPKPEEILDKEPKKD